MIELDELFSSHYFYFKKYKSYGEIPFIVSQLDAKIEKEIHSIIDGITIWINDWIEKN